MFLALPGFPPHANQQFPNANRQFIGTSSEISTGLPNINGSSRERNIDNRAGHSSVNRVSTASDFNSQLNTIHHSEPTSPRRHDIQATHAASLYERPESMHSNENIPDEKNGFIQPKHFARSTPSMPANRTFSVHNRFSALEVPECTTSDTTIDTQPPSAIPSDIKSHSTRECQVHTKKSIYITPQEVENAKTVSSQRYTYNSGPPENHRITIIGDSTVHRLKKNRFNQALDRGRMRKFTIPGYEAKMIEHIIDVELQEPRLFPDTVIIHAGSNDLGHHRQADPA